MSLTQYVKRLRINLACQILMSDEQASIASICYEIGYNNLSNFNRQFLAEKGMTPLHDVCTEDQQKSRKDQLEM
jgi:AraC-like DNA-binding protein